MIWKQLIWSFRNNDKYQINQVAVLGDFGGFMGLKLQFLDKKWHIFTFLIVYDSENHTNGI